MHTWPLIRGAFFIYNVEFTKHSPPIQKVCYIQTNTIWEYNMNLMKFIILNHNENQQSEEKTSILINPDHIISVKPIKMTTSDRNIIDGYWVRLSNGKKYKAIQVPESIKKTFFDELPSISISDNNFHELNIQ